MKKELSFCSVAVIGILLSVITGCKKDNSSDANTIRDVDGNTYHTVTIGTQVWMSDNLRTTHYRDSSAISKVEDNSAWSNLTSGAYCSYENSADNAGTYGFLYNWYAGIDSRNICPIGWHIPTDSEWQTLVDYLGGNNTAGDKLKETGTAHWVSPNTDATNESGFNGLPGGYRHNLGGFSNIGYYGFFLSATEDQASYGWYRFIRSSSGIVARSSNIKGFGASVRCIKD